MARSFALRVAAATLVAATTTVGLSAWISGTSAAPVTTLAGKLSSGAGATLLVERGDDHESRIIAGEGAYASIVETAEHSGGVCQSRDGYRNADPAGLSPLVSRYSVTRCDLDDVGIAVYSWAAGEYPQFGFDQEVEPLNAAGASIVVAQKGVRGVGQQLIFGDTLAHVAEWATAALAAQGQPGYRVDCGTHRVGVDEGTVDCVATGPTGELLPARVRIDNQQGLAQVTLGEGPAQVR